MKKYIISLILLGIVFGAKHRLIEKKSVPSINFENNSRTFRTGDYGLVCQNESGSYNTDMENYIYSPVINVPTGNQVGVDFLLRGSLLDGDAFPDVDFWGMQITANGGQSWNYVSNPYGDTSATANNYVYSDAPEFWSLFSTTYSEPIDISDYAGSSIQLRYWFHSDSDAPQGEGLFLDDIAVSVDGENIYFESFEDSTMAGWVSVDETSSEPEWHTDTYGAFNGAGKSWWMGDPDVGSVGGYKDDWYQVLDTPPVTIPSGTNSYSLTFDQKRAIEALCAPSGGNFCPSCTGESLNQVTDQSVDGWDAFNVRISSDGGDTWEILQDVTPSYNSLQNWAFGVSHDEGCNIPAWGGPESSNPTWENTTVQIPTEYNGQEIMIRFAFASDGAYSTEYNTTTNTSLTGVWVDNIDIAGVFTNDGEDTTGFQSKSLVTVGGDLWHVDFIGVPPVIPMPSNVIVTALDGSVEVSWDSPSGAEEYSNELISYSNENFVGNSIVVTTGQGYLGTLFDMPYGVESATAHSVRVHASSAGSTTLAGFAVIGGIPAPTPLYTQTISTVENAYSDEITLNWEFQSSFIIALLVAGEIGLSIDETAVPSSNSWSNLGGWEPWSDVAAAASLGDGEFGIQAIVTSQGGSAPVFNVYRDPGIDGSSYQLMFNGTGISSTTYIDNIVSNGVEYCYRIACVFDEAISEKTDPVCGLPISNFVYEIAYDDGSHEDVVPVGNGNLLASKFTPNGYPSDLYSAKFYVAGSQSGTVLVYVWKDNGAEGEPGDIIIAGLPKNLTQGWNDVNFANGGFDIEISEGGVYIGYQQLDVNFNIGIDGNNASNSQNSMLNINLVTEGWEPLNNLSPDGVWMIRAEFDGENALSTTNESPELLPNEFVLNQNYPNPFNPSTAIEFGLKEQSLISLEIFNMLGENVLTIVNDRLDAGFHRYKLDMDNFSSGMYFYKLVATNKQGQQIFNDMKKMILLQ